MIKNSKISKHKFVKLIQCFCLDLTAIQTKELLSLNRNTTNRYFNILRRCIHNHQVFELKRFKGEIEVDESYFGARRVKGRATKRGRGTHKQPVFGIFERNGKVYTEIIPNCAMKTLRDVIRGKIDFKSTIYSDSWLGYKGLVDVGYDKHYRINHSNDEFSNNHGVHINGIESFWSFTKRRLSKFNGVKKNFNLHLKECEWRWSKSYQQLQEEIYQIIKNRF